MTTPTAVTEIDGSTAFRNFVGGEWLPGSANETFEDRGPWDPDRLLGEFPRSGPEDVDAAVDAAAAAFPAWSALPGPQRAAVLFRAAEASDRRAEELSQAMSLETGKPIREARLEAARCGALLRFFAGEGWRSRGECFDQSITNGSLYTQRRPLGVVALITPWNFPASIPLWKAAPALVFGNTVVLKPSQDSPLSAVYLAELLAEAGMPPGVFNVVNGSGSTVGPRLIAHDDVRAVSLTGSVPVGNEVRRLATEHGKPAQLELGGHNPLIVMADADLERAVEAAFMGAYWSAGQKCTATRRIYVERSVRSSFADRLLERIGTAAVGDPSDPATEVGPLVNEHQLEGVLAAVERARQEGGAVLAGGERAHSIAPVMAPTLFGDVEDGATLSCEEVFGPVASLYEFDTLDEAIERANAIRFGLSAGIFTRDLRTVDEFTRHMRAGMLHVNSQTPGAELHAPFGGIKESGWGPREMGRSALEFFTESITVYQDV